METDRSENLKSTEGMVDHDEISGARQRLVKVRAGLIRPFQLSGPRNFNAIMVMSSA